MIWYEVPYTEALEYATVIAARSQPAEQVGASSLASLHDQIAARVKGHG